MNDEYWKQRCEFWCARYLELAQAVRPVIISASRVDDYAELQFHVQQLERLLRRDAYGQPDDRSAGQ